jgi:SAM-dependent methyltransferase
MREDVKAFVELAAGILDIPEPIVEVGAYQVSGQEGFADLRAFFPGKRYLGCDLVSGPGVDQVEDLHDLSFADATIGTTIVMETLEHVADPYRAVCELHRVLQPGGLAVVSMPFNFPVHYMPDYTRFTPEGLARVLSIFASCAVFFQGDAQDPHTVYGVALKQGSDARTFGFEAAVGRFQNRWNLGEAHDPLTRFQPVVSVVRWDHSDGNVGPLRPGRYVEQRFRCSHNGLVRIDVKVDLLGARSAGRVRLSVADEAGTQLTSTETPARFIWEQRWVAFEFPPVEESAGRRLTARLEVLDEPSAVTALASSTDRLPDTELVVDGRQHAGTLCFEAFCQRSGSPNSPPLQPPGVSVLTAERESTPVVVAARLQATELRFLHAEIERLRREVRDVAQRVDKVGERVRDEFAMSLRRYWPTRTLLNVFARVRRR